MARTKKINLEKLQKELEKKAKKRERKRKPKMRISGRGVFELRKIIKKKVKYKSKK